MKVEVLNVAGFDEAFESMRYSFDSKPEVRWVRTEPMAYRHEPYHAAEDDLTLLRKLTVAGDSHAKVNRMIQIWARIDAPRYWWTEFDTYHIGMTEMSESTVHTIKKEIRDHTLSLKNFEVSEFSKDMIEAWLTRMYALDYKDKLATMPVEQIKQTIPESFMQRRMVNLNYQTLRHIYFDRRNHRMAIWHKFLDDILEQLPFKELIISEKEVG